MLLHHVFDVAPKPFCSLGEILAVTTVRDQERDESHCLSRLSYSLHLLPRKRTDLLMNNGLLRWGFVHGNETAPGSGPAFQLPRGRLRH